MKSKVDKVDFYVFSSHDILDVLVPVLERDTEQFAARLIESGLDKANIYLQVRQDREQSLEVVNKVAAAAIASSNVKEFAMYLKKQGVTEADIFALASTLARDNVGKNDPRVNKMIAALQPYLGTLRKSFDQLEKNLKTPTVSSSTKLKMGSVYFTLLIGEIKVKLQNLVDSAKYKLFTLRQALHKPTSESQERGTQLRRLNQHSTRRAA